MTGRRTRVLLYSQVFPPRRGGSGRWLWELYRRLPGLDVRVLAEPVEGSQSFDAESPMAIRRSSAAFRTWGAFSPSGIRGYSTAARELGALIRDFDPDVVHCGKCLPEGLATLVARRRRDLPFWCFAHGEELTLAATSRELSILASMVLRRAAHVVANSQHTRRLLLDRWPVRPERVSVLTPGVDARRFTPAPPDAAMRGALGWDGRRVVLTVGALQRRKGQDMMIRALPEIRRRCPDVLYAIAGEGWEIDGLQRLADELDVRGQVAFLGTPDEQTLVHYYQQCDLFVLANRQIGWDFEGFGIVLLEAQACGKAVITGRSGGTSETIRPGETGELVSCETPQPLAEACVALLEDAERRQTLGARGRRWILERFDWPVLVGQAATLMDAPASPADRG